MTLSAQLIAFSAKSKPARPLKALLFAGVVAGLAAVPHPANAKRARMAPGAYDGTWNVLFVTQTGNCSSNNSIPFAVTGRRVSSAGGGRVSGGISPGGAVSVHVSVGASAADGSGRLVGNSGTGRWSGIISGDRCTGSWQATRS